MIDVEIAVNLGTAEVTNRYRFLRVALLEENSTTAPLSAYTPEN